MFSRVVQRCRRVQNGFLSEVEDFRDVDGCLGGAFHTCLHFLVQRRVSKGLFPQLASSDLELVHYRDDLIL